MQLLNENETTRTWIYEGDEAASIFENYRTMLANIQLISKRLDEALKDMRTMHSDEREVLRLKYDVEAAELLAQQAEKEAESATPFHDEIRQESINFHSALYQQNPNLTRIYMPMININQYEAGSGIVTILEKYNDNSWDNQDR